jgi:hypothetical protein
MSPTLKLRNRPPASALMTVAYSQAWTAMRFLIRFLLAWPRTTRAAFGIGAVVLLFYGASFLTRDWRTIVPTVDQPAAVQAATRSKAEPRSLPSKLADLPVPVEPATTGALTRITPAVEAPPAEPTAARRPASAPPRLQARPATPRSPKQKPSRGTQVAARPAVVEPTPVPPPTSFLERLFQVRLAERGN